MSKKNYLAEETPIAEYEYSDDLYFEEEDAASVSAGGYRFLSVLLLIFAVGGLFLGFLSKWVTLFTPLATAGDGVLGNTMLWVIVDSAMGLFTGTSVVEFGIGSDAYGMIQLVLSYFPYVIALAVVLSLILTIVALASRKNAKNATYVNAYLLFFAYGGFFIVTFVTRALCGFTAWMELIDIPSALIAGVVLLCLFFVSLGRKKGYALLNFLLLLLGIGAAFGFLYRESATLAGLQGAFAWDKSGIAFITQILILAIAALLVLNFIISALRLGAKKGWAFDLVRFLLLFAATVALFAFYVFKPETEAAPYWGILAKLPSIVLLATTFAAFLIPMLCCIAKGAKKRKAKKAAMAEEEQQEEPVAPVEEATSAIAAAPAPVVKEAAPAPAPAPTPVVVNTAAPAPAAPIVVTAPAPAPTPVVVNTPAPAPVSPVVIQLAPVPVAAPAPAPSPAPAPAPAPVVEEKKPVEKTAAMSEFEMRMAELAKGNAPAPVMDAAPVNVPKYTYAQKPVAANYDASVQYTYDAFFHTLSPSEKTEFGDLFISNKFGTHSYLPTYVIGGDNSAFFARVFIYLGKFRSVISNGLLEKIYVFVNTRN